MAEIGVALLTFAPARTHDLVELGRDRDAIATDYAERYAAWRARFNPRDDGRAAARVVQRLLAEGRLG